MLGDGVVGVGRLVEAVAPAGVADRRVEDRLGPGARGDTDQATDLTTDLTADLTAAVRPVTRTWFSRVPGRPSKECAFKKSMST